MASEKIEIPWCQYEWLTWSLHKTSKVYFGAGCPSLAGRDKHSWKARPGEDTKCAAHIILGSNYSSYQDALETLQLDSLEHRRKSLALRFAIKAERHSKFKAWFKPAIKPVNTRAKMFRYCDVKANHTRFAKSPLSFLTKMLNMHYYKKDWFYMYLFLISEL